MPAALLLTLVVALVFVAAMWTADGLGAYVSEAYETWLSGGGAADEATASAAVAVDAPVL